jgi:hypothetical protein
VIELTIADGRALSGEGTVAGVLRAHVPVPIARNIIGEERGAPLETLHSPVIIR